MDDPRGPRAAGSDPKTALTRHTNVGDVLSRLEVGEGPARLAEDLGLEPAELIAVLGLAALGEEGTPGPALVRTAPARPGLAGALGEPRWAPLLPAAPRGLRLALAAGLLQVHDFWEASHEAAQQADDLGERTYSAYWHAIAHRREPDASNAAYWFRRVGKTPLFNTLALAARPLLEAHGVPELTLRLAPGGVWNPLAFNDLCGDGRPPAGASELARRLQRLELTLLLKATAAAAAAAATRP